ncbi:MAG TPA: flagellar hook-basal body protein [Candidatus Eremiobacteraceae bacterium]|nr:flagellar hook-basal body protein [Candidatus Eremiobacteraceae bacterium]
MDAPDSLSSAAAGMRVQQNHLAAIAENLANANTPGFHARSHAAAGFEDGLRDSTSTSAAEGSVRRTDVDTDLALIGPGYFCVATPDGVRYTRDGRMARDPSGVLTDSHGHRVLGSLGPAHFPPSARIASDGRIMVGQKVIDRLRIADVESPIAANSGYFSAPTARVARASARVQQGYLEDSSVNAIAEMTALVATQRAFEANQKSVQRVDETLKRAANEISRVRS